MSADSVSVRVHRVQDGKGTVSVPASRVPSGTSGRAQPLAPTMPTKWRDMSKKEKKAIRAQRRGILNRLARAGLLHDPYYPWRRWVSIARESAVSAVAEAVSLESGMDPKVGRQKGMLDFSGSAVGPPTPDEALRHRRPRTNADTPNARAALSGPLPLGSAWQWEREMISRPRPPSSAPAESETVY